MRVVDEASLIAGNECAAITLVASGSGGADGPLSAGHLWRGVRSSEAVIQYCCAPASALWLRVASRSRAALNAARTSAVIPAVRTQRKRFNTKFPMGKTMKSSSKLRKIPYELEMAALDDLPPPIQHQLQIGSFADGHRTERAGICGLMGACAKVDKGTSIEHAMNVRAVLKLRAAVTFCILPPGVAMAAR
jgi:hypothetical protein